MLTPVILSGGAGTRLWPLSRELYPKQLLPLTGAHTLLQQTLLRLSGMPAAGPIVVCNEAHRFLVAEQLRQLQATPQAIPSPNLAGATPALRSRSARPSWAPVPPPRSWRCCPPTT